MNGWGWVNFVLERLYIWKRSLICVTCSFILASAVLSNLSYNFYSARLEIKLVKWIHTSLIPVPESLEKHDGLIELCFKGLCLYQPKDIFHSFTLVLYLDIWLYNILHMHTMLHWGNFGHRDLWPSGLYRTILQSPWLKLNHKVFEISVTMFLH